MIFRFDVEVNFFGYQDHSADGISTAFVQPPIAVLQQIHHHVTINGSVGLTVCDVFEIAYADILSQLLLRFDIRAIENHLVN